jgi:RNA polymerase sigma factor (sigma-70 family)
VGAWFAGEHEAANGPPNVFLPAHRPIETRPSADDERIKIMQELDKELLQIAPTSYALFRHDVIHQPKVNLWPKEQLDELVQKAREGDQEARDLLILSCLSFVFYRGWRYKDDIFHDDPMDLVSIGSLALVESLEKALYADNPIKYLISQAAYAIQHYVFHESPMIRRDKHRNVVTPVASLDQELGHTDLTYLDVIGILQEVDLFSKAEEEEETDDLLYAPLYQAIDRLTKKQRTVVMRHFGLDSAPETLADIGRSLSIRPESAWKLWRLAQKRLRKFLGDQYR